VRQLHLPIVDQTRDPPAPRFRPRRVARFQTLEEIYVFMLDEYAARFGAVMRVVADPDQHPLVFHCAAGKDRTGIVAALVLSACGVDDVDIVADFAYTERRMPEIIARHVVRAERTDVPAEVASQQYGAQPVAMEATLAHLRDAYGSVEGYLVTAGLDDGAVARLRDALLTDPSDPS
jgi:protein-tyrosine phosphatase